MSQSSEAGNESSGYDYEPGLQLVPSRLDEVGKRDRWQDEGLCHGSYELFDLVDMEAVDIEKDEVKSQNSYRVRAARRICFECPVFETCWDDALLTLPNGVIRAGARLNNPLPKKRERALTVAWDSYQQYKQQLQEDHDDND